MKSTTYYRVCLGLFAAAWLILGLQGCNRETADKFIASGKAYLEKRDFQAAIIQFKNAVQKDPDSGEARSLLGTALEEADDPASAEIELRKALSAGYSPDRVYPILVRVLLEQGEFEKAVSEATPHLGNPPNAQLLALTGNAQLGLRKLQEARAAFSGALIVEPANETAMLGMARLTAIEQDLPRAEQLVDQVLRQYPSSREAVLLKGDLLLAAKRDKEAAEAYQKAIELRPQSVRVYLNLVPLLVRQGDLTGARARVDALKHFAPRAATTLYLDALVAYAQGDRPRAREAIEGVLRTTPNYIPALLLAGTVAYDVGNYAQAEDHLRKVIKATPKQAYPRRLLISTYLRTGQVEQAKEALDGLVQLAPNEAATLTLAGEVALANRDLNKAADYYQKALATDPKNALMRTRLGQVHLAAGDTQRAIQDLETASAADTSQWQADVALVMVHLKQKQFDEAQAVADALTKKQPDNPLTYNLAGLVRLAKQDQAGGRSSFEHALQLQPTYFPAARNLAILDLRDGHPDAAMRRYEGILAKDAKNEQALLAIIELLSVTRAPAPDVEKAIDRAIAANPASVRPRVLKVNYLLQRGDSKTALNAAQQAEAAIPQNPEVLVALGRAQMAAGAPDQAIVTFGKLVSLNPKAPAPLMAQAEAYAAAKDWAGARQALQKTIELKPDVVQPRLGLVQVDIKAGLLKEAQAEARTIQKRWPTQSSGYIAEVDVLTAQKDLGEAERLLRGALQTANSPALVMRLYSLLDGQERRPEADALAGKWMEQNPKDSLVASYVAAVCLEHKDYPAAVRWNKSALRAQPNNAVTLNNLAWALGQLQDPAALEYGQRALSLSPNAPAIMDTVGWLYVERGDLTRGLELLTKAHELAPKAPSIELNLAKALIKAGQGKAAREHLEVLAKLPPGTAIRDDAQKLLSSL